MKIDILASGSAGNCIAITVGEKTILIDAGIAKTKIEKALMNVNIRPDQVEAVFITHAHGDHVKGLPFANKYGIPVYAGADEWESIKSVDDDLKCSAFKENGVYESFMFDMGEMAVIPFGVHHDAREPLGYKVLAGNKQVSICLDTGHVDAAMLSAMADSDIYVIESNHEPRMVEASSYPNSVKARIISHIGHLSNHQTAEALSKLVQGNGEQIYLVHLSDKNNMPALAAMTVKRELLKKGLTVGKHYELEVV
ncbi:MBL fold metallo-hydrolase [Sporosarcina sp. P18a]|uniref:MBL fold metallo-hydrolase n=1 Tax=Sporosarcina sp. P18a TaxID=2048259 RepID=UPI000C1700DD|nr:MBL fold metallo-hydrolase [Sporosarcina sp. P18a]PIC80522.1 MBL fold metallo-hydrolase [Sporosarcina sp. P18a]